MSAIVGVRFAPSELAPLERVAPGRGERSSLVRVAVGQFLRAIELSASEAAKEWAVPSFPIRRAIVAAIVTGEPCETRLSRSKRWLAVVASPDGCAWRTFAGSSAFESVHGFPLTWKVSEKMGFGLRFHVPGGESV